jgi:hypothetical protein
MGWEYSLHGVIRDVFRIWAGKCVGRLPLEGPTRTWKGIEINIREVGVGYNMDVAATGSRPITIYASRFLVVWRNIPRIARYSQ